MSWLAVVKLLLTLAVGVMDYFARKRMIDVGKARQLTKSLKRTLEMVDEAKQVENNYRKLTPAQRRLMRERYRARDK